MLSMKNKKEETNFYIWTAFLSLVCIPLAFIPGATLLGDRWGLIAELLLCIPLAIVVTRLVVFRAGKNIWISRAKFTLGITFIMMLCFLLIMNTDSNMDNPLMSNDLAIKRGLTTSELEGTSFSVEHYSITNITTDQYNINSYYQYYGPNPGTSGILKKTC